MAEQEKFVEEITDKDDNFSKVNFLFASSTPERLAMVGV